MRKRIGLLAAGSLVVGGLIVTGSGAAHAADRDVVLTSGHIDLFEVTYDDTAEQLRLLVKDDTRLLDPGIVFRDPHDVTIAVDADLSAVTVPDLPAFAFLGEPGDTVHLLPQSQNQQLPWPGWSTERLASTLPGGVTLAGGMPVELALEVDGPGDVHAWANNATGDVINHYVDTTDDDPEIIPIASNAHVHINWSFSETGDYCFAVTPRAATTTEQVLTGPTTSYHVRVGEPSAEPGDPCVEESSELELNLTPNRADAQYLYGQGITVTAEPSEATDLDRYRWLVKRAGAADFEISERSVADQLRLPTSPVWDGTEVVAQLLDADDEVAATSAPLTLSVTVLEPVTSLTATADQETYRAGDIAQFQVAQDPETGEHHYHWYVRKPGEEFFTYIPGQDHAEAELEIAADHDGAEIVARLFDDAHAVTAESAPLTLTLEDGADEPVATTAVVAASAVTQPFGAKRPARAEVRVQTADGDPAHGSVTVRAGSRVVADGLVLDAAGAGSVTLPRALRVGSHPLTAAFTPADTAGQDASTSAATPFRVVKAPARVRLVTKKRARVGNRARAVVRVGMPQSAGVKARGRVVVRAGKQRVGRAQVRNGRAVLRLKRLPVGRHRLVAVFRGNAQTSGARSARVVLRVVR